MNDYASGSSERHDLDEAITEALQAAGLDRAPESPDLLVCFARHAYGEELERLGSELRERTGARIVLGNAAEGIAGSGREIEEGPGLALWAARCPDARLQPFRLEVQVLEETAEERQLVVRGLPELTAKSAEEIAQRQLSVMVLADPYSFPSAEWLEVMHEQYPGMPVFGGMASGANRPGGNRLFLDGAQHRSGAVGVLIENWSVRTLVSQGCRPIGPNMVVTRGQENIVEELAGKPAAAQLQDIYDSTEGEERELLHTALESGGLFLGEVVDERIPGPGQGDFLVRGILGVDRENGAVRIAARARRGRTVCFHVRDPASADAELRLLLRERQDDAIGGALLFTCNGRGTRMFDTPHHDAECVDKVFPRLPLAGFFAQGEIGPVGGRNFVHGFTASLALFGTE